jgi:hypothetical protein
MPRSVSTTSAAAMPTSLSSLARIHIHPRFVIHIFYFIRLRIPRCSCDAPPADRLETRGGRKRRQGRRRGGVPRLHCVPGASIWRGWLLVRLKVRVGVLLIRRCMSSPSSPLSSVSL